MDDSIYRFFEQNLENVTKEQMLDALKDALESASCWRQACLAFREIAVVIQENGDEN